MKEQYRKEIAWWFAELGSESEVDNYLALFPELNSRLSKFAIGILNYRGFMRNDDLLEKYADINFATAFNYADLSALKAIESGEI